MKNNTMNDFNEAVSKIYAEEERQLEKGHYDPDYLMLQMAERRFHLAHRYRVLIEIKEEFKYEYIEALINSGTYLKGRRIDEGSNHKRIAQTFLGALRLEKTLPVAHYRLGHVFYGVEEYTDSLYHFNRSLEVNNVKFKRFNLDIVQENTAKKFIAYLSILNYMQHKENAILHDKYPELDNKFTEFEYTLKKSIESDLPIKCQVQGKDPYRVGLEEYEEYLDSENYFVIDRYRNEHVIAFNSVETRLTIKESQILVDSLLYSKDESYSLPDAIMLNSIDANRQKIRRLRNKITSGCRMDDESLGLYFHQNGTKQCISFAPKIPVVIFSRPND